MDDTAKGDILGTMLKTVVLLVTVCASVTSFAQAPSTATLTLSLKTMSKALAGCRESYTRVYPGSTAPLLKSVVGTDNYNKTLMSLGQAEKMTNVLIARPDKVAGRFLVAILSSSDDFSVGVGSTRTEVMSQIALKSANAHRVNELILASESLNACQKSLFNAGDDYVGLVMDFVGAEDNALTTLSGQKGERVR